jgi:hypothetical protein
MLSKKSEYQVMSSLPLHWAFKFKSLSLENWFTHTSILIQDSIPENGVNPIFLIWRQHFSTIAVRLNKSLSLSANHITFQPSIAATYDLLRNVPAAVGTSTMQWIRVWEVTWHQDKGQVTASARHLTASPPSGPLETSLTNQSAAESRYWPIRFQLW